MQLICYMSCFMGRHIFVSLLENPSQMQLNKLVFNPFQVNTYILSDETGECVIIDPACYGPDEQTLLSDHIHNNDLKVSAVLFTHGHIDHILGAAFVKNTYQVKSMAHKDSISFFEGSAAYGTMFGFDIETPPLPEIFLSQDDMVTFGSQRLKVLHTPGHANGSICFYSEAEKLLIAGDVLFQGSIGRTDLPTGNYELLINSIENQLLVLPAEVKVYPGHGPATTIGFERENNPFLTGISL
jgi:hydroxyacylglutathione hydrolase